MPTAQLLTCTQACLAQSFLVCPLTQLPFPPPRSPTKHQFAYLLGCLVLAAAHQQSFPGSNHRTTTTTSSTLATRPTHTTTPSTGSSPAFPPTRKTPTPLELLTAAPPPWRRLCRLLLGHLIQLLVHNVVQAVNGHGRVRPGGVVGGGGGRVVGVDLCACGCVWVRVGAEVLEEHHGDD